MTEKKVDRRSFLSGAATAVGATALAGCVCDRLASDAGAPMFGFACKPLARVRVGVVGLGSRGGAAVTRLLQVPGVEIAALCEVRGEYLRKSSDEVLAQAGRRPVEFLGEERWKALCDSDKVDVVYNCTPWHLHAPIGVYAMKAGKHVMIEVPAAMFVDECWELVETAETTRRHCLQLENCCYGEEELLFLNMSRKGVLGEILHGEGGYLHDRRWQIFNDDQWNAWRRDWNVRHAGNQYSTHGLGPVCQYMDVNRGDRLDYLVSTDGAQRGYERFAAGTLPADDPRRKLRFAMADMNVTTIRTVRGRTILLEHDVTGPSPYSRLNLVQGTKGVVCSYPKLRMYLEDRLPASDAVHEWFDDPAVEKLRREYMHPLYRTLGERAKTVKGHGGMDFIMDYRWSFCLRKGLPLDTNVYDLASWCAVNELSERSARNRSASVDIPDFTRGAWKTAKPFDIVDIKEDRS